MVELGYQLQRHVVPVVKAMIYGSTQVASAWRLYVNEGELERKSLRSSEALVQARVISSNLNVEKALPEVQCIHCIPDNLHRDLCGKGDRLAAKEEEEMLA